jgi:hypothetical protein
LNLTSPSQNSHSKCTEHAGKRRKCMQTRYAYKETMCEPTDVTATERKTKCTATSSHFLHDRNFEFRLFALRAYRQTLRLLLGAEDAREWYDCDGQQCQRQCLGRDPSTRSYTNTRICDGLRHVYRVWASNRGVNTGTDGKAEDDDVDGRHSFFVSFLPSSHFLPPSLLLSSSLPSSLISYWPPLPCT